MPIWRKNSKFRQNRVSNVNFSPRITKTHCISKILQTLYMFSQCTIIGLRSGWNWQYIPDFVESRYFFLPAWPANRHSAALDLPEHTTGTYLNLMFVQLWLTNSTPNQRIENLWRISLHLVQAKSLLDQINQIPLEGYLSWYFLHFLWVIVHWGRKLSKNFWLVHPGYFNRLKLHL